MMEVLFTDDAILGTKEEFGLIARDDLGVSFGRFAEVVGLCNVIQDTLQAQQDTRQDWDVRHGERVRFLQREQLYRVLAIT